MKEVRGKSNERKNTLPEDVNSNRDEGNGPEKSFASNQMGM